MTRKRKIINTGFVESKFFDGSDFKMEVDIGRSYIKSDTPATILLYNIDYQFTKTHSLYGETKASQKVVKDPIELQVRYTVLQNDTAFISGSNIPRQFAGDLVFIVYEDELKEKNAEIRRGDYISLKNIKGFTQNYEVYHDDRLNTSNNKSIAGLGAFYKEVRCRAVDSDVFKN